MAIKHVSELAEAISAASQVEERIKWWVGDIIKLIDNINQTSVNEADKKLRLEALEAKTGIPGIYNLFKKP